MAKIRGVSHSVRSKLRIASANNANSRIKVNTARANVGSEKSEKEKKNKTYWLVVSGLIFFKKNTPLMLKPWITSYVFLRKMKNWADVVLKRGELAPTVRKAYKDFENARF